MYSTFSFFSCKTSLKHFKTMAIFFRMPSLSLPTVTLQVDWWGAEAAWHALSSMASYPVGPAVFDRFAAKLQCSRALEHRLGFPKDETSIFQKIQGGHYGTFQIYNISLGGGFNLTHIFQGWNYQPVGWHVATLGVLVPTSDFRGRENWPTKSWSGDIRWPTT